MSKAACKIIIDSGGRNRGTSRELDVTLETMATSLAMFGVPETPAGDKWLADVTKFHEKAAKELDGLVSAAMLLCMSQPIE